MPNLPGQPNFKSKNFYQRLGVSEDATPSEIKEAFTRLSKELHPDGNGKGNSDAVASYKAVTEAYTDLKNPEKRLRHDQSLPLDPMRRTRQESREIAESRRKMAERRQKEEQDARQATQEDLAAQRRSEEARTHEEEERVRKAQEPQAPSSVETLAPEPAIEQPPHEQEVPSSPDTSIEEVAIESHEAAEKAREELREMLAKYGQTSLEPDGEEILLSEKEEGPPKPSSMPEDDNGKVSGERPPTDRDNVAPEERAAMDAVWGTPGSTASSPEREALLKAEKAVQAEEAKFYTQNSAIGRVLKRRKGETKNLDVLEKKMDTAAVAYETKLREDLKVRMKEREKGYEDLQGRKVAAGLKVRSTPEGFAKKVAERYHRAVISKEVVDRGEKARAVARAEALRTKETGFFGKCMRVFGERSAALDNVLAKKLGPDAAKYVRMGLRVTSSALVGTLLGPLPIGQLLLRAAVGTIGGAALGAGAGAVYEKTFGAAAKQKLTEAHAIVARSGEDIAAKRRAYSKGSAEAIATKRARVEAGVAALTGAGVSIGMGGGFASTPTSELPSVSQTEVQPSGASPEVAPEISSTKSANAIPPVAGIGETFKSDLPPAEAPSIAAETATPPPVDTAPITPEPPPAYKGPLPPLEAPPAPEVGIEPPAQPPAPPPAVEAPTLPQTAPSILDAAPPAPQPSVLAPETAIEAPVREVYASVEATKGKGYEFMAKRIWEQLQGKYVNVDELLAAKPHLKDSDLHKLLMADAKSINGVVHRIAMDPGHGFFRPDGSVLIKPGDVLSIDENGMLRMNDAVKAPTGAPLTPSTSGPSAAELEARVKSALDARELNIRSAENPQSFNLSPQEVPTPPEPQPAIETQRGTAPPAPSVEAPATATAPPTKLEPLLTPERPPESPLTPSEAPSTPVKYESAFTNSSGTFVDPTQGSVYEDARGTLMAYGNDYSARLAAAREYVAANRGATVYLQSQKLIPIEGEWMPAVVEVRHGGFLRGIEVIEPKPGELEKVGEINPNTFTNQITRSA